MSLTAEHVTVRFGPPGRVARRVPGATGVAPGQRVALDDVTIAVERGACLTVVGPNGAGKSTLVKVLSGQVRPASGTVVLDAAPLASLGGFALARRVAVVEQGPALPAGFLTSDVVAMGRTPHLGLFGAPSTADEDAVRRAMQETGTADLAHRPVDTLSGGERQRVVLARAMAQGADHLLLDEPTNHLDLRYQVEVLAFARRAAAAGAAVLLVLHDLNLAARVSDLVVMMAGGRVVAAGPPTEVLTPTTIGDVYGTTVGIVYDAGVPVVVPRLASR